MNQTGDPNDEGGAVEADDQANTTEANAADAAADPVETTGNGDQAGGDPAEVDISGGDDAGKASEAADTPADDQAAETPDPAEDAGNEATVDISDENEAATDPVTDELDPADPPAPTENEDAAADEPEDPKPIAASTPAAGGIEAAAEAANEAEPHKPDLPPEKLKAEPAAKVAMPKQKRAKATARKKQTDGSKGKAAKPNANQAHLAAKRASRPEPPEPREKTEAEIQAAEKKAAVVEELVAIKAELEEMDEFRAKLVARQQELVSPTPAKVDEMPFAERIKQVQARGTEIRTQRVRDRLKLLARGAGMSPLDRALHDRPRANADPAPNTGPTT